MAHPANITAGTQSDMLALAHNIIRDGASVTIGSRLSADEEREFLEAAQWFIDTDGEDPDLEYLIQREEAWEAYGQYAHDAEFRVTPMEFDEWAEREGLAA